MELLPGGSTVVVAEDSATNNKLCLNGAYILMGTLIINIK